MTIAKDTQFKVEVTHENLKDNLQLIQEEAHKLEQCLIAVGTFARFNIDINKYEPMLDEIIDIAENIDCWTDHASVQYSNLHKS